MTEVKGKSIDPDCHLAQYRSQRSKARASTLTAILPSTDHRGQRLEHRPWLQSCPAGGEGPGTCTTSMNCDRSVKRLAILTALTVAQLQAISNSSCCSSCICSVNFVMEITDCDSHQTHYLIVQYLYHNKARAFLFPDLKNLLGHFNSEPKRSSLKCNDRYHRVDRVLGFFSSRPNLDPPPHPQASASPLWFRGRDTLACGRGGGHGEVPIRKGQTLWYIL